MLSIDALAVRAWKLRHISKIFIEKYFGKQLKIHEIRKILEICKKLVLYGGPQSWCQGGRVATLQVTEVSYSTYMSITKFTSHVYHANLTNVV